MKLTRSVMKRVNSNMQLIEFSIESEKWNDIVKRFHNYSVFDLKEYQLASCLLNAEIPRLLLFEHNNQYAMITIHIKDIAHDENFSSILNTGEYFDISSAYGYGGMISDTDYYPIDDFLRYCKEKSYISDFVRFNLFSNYKDYYKGEVESHSHNIVVNLEQSLESIISGYDRKVRKNLRVAERNDLTIIQDSNFVYLDDFLRIYYSTMQRNNASDNFLFYERIFSIDY